MNGVQHHYTGRDGDGARRTTDALSVCYLEPGEERRLRLGDVVEFLTAVRSHGEAAPSHLFYCVVGLGGTATAAEAARRREAERLQTQREEAEW